MYHHSREKRIVSLDVHSKTLAYAIFEGPIQLLDFSVSRSTHSGFQASRVETLVRKFQPDVIVLRKVHAGSSRDTPASRAAIKSIRAKTRNLSAPVVFIDKQLINETFQPHCKPTKHKIAVLLAACYPALTWYVPRKRKPWMPEDRRMQYFDAAATGLAYFTSNGDAEIIQQLLSDAVSRSQNLAENT
jgi:hypothetical protein